MNMSVDGSHRGHHHHAITTQPSKSHRSHHGGGGGGGGGCPPGMEYIMGTSNIIVKQEVELLEVFTGFDTNNRYQILDVAGRRMYFALEQSPCLARICFSSNRPFTILILNNNGAVCLKVIRECNFCYCCFLGRWCGVIRVFSGQDELIGEVVQNCDCGCPHFTVKDAQGNPKLFIKGPCGCCMFCVVDFKVEDTGGIEIGQIQKTWGGVVQEAYTTADTFGLAFPPNLDPRMKCLLLGATFMIDMMFFEHKNKDSD